MKKNLLFKMLAVLIVLITGVQKMWSDSYTFTTGQTIYYDFTALSTDDKKGVNWFDGVTNLDTQYDESGAGTLKTVTFTEEADKTWTDSYWISKTERGSWAGIVFTSFPSSGENVIRINSEGTSYTWETATYAIAGEMNDWSTTANTATTGSVEFKLDAHTTYDFKVVFKGGKDIWCGMGSTWISSSVSDYGCTWNGGDNIHLMTAGAGTYTFTYDYASNQLSITYPTATHPSINYCYLYKYTWSNAYLELHTTNDSHDTKAWPGQELFSPATTTIGTTPVYFCAMGSNYTEIQFDDNSDNYTGYQDPSSGWGKYMYYNTSTSAWEWTAFTVRITLNNQSATTAGTEYKDARFNDEALTTSITKPTKTGYSFGGYYTATGGGGSQIIDANGAWVASVSGYTDASKKWIHEGGTATLYAKWTAKTTTVSFNQTSGSGGQTSNVTAIYDAAMPTPITRPTRAGYSFQGYFDGEGGTGTKYYNADGTSARNWDKEDATCTLHAKWTEVALTFSSAGNWNVAGNWTETSSGSAGCIPTSSHDVTIRADVTVNINNAVAKTLTISGGKLTIPATGALEVAGAITNTDASKIVIKSSNTNQGALIFNSDGTAKATVELTMQYADPDVGKFQMVAIPVSYVAVSEAFAGTGAYTFAWKHGTGWDQRGYYEGFSAFEAVLVKGKGGTSFSGALVSTENKSYTGLSIADVDNGDVYMFGNSWTAPIQVSAMTLTNATVSILNGSSQDWDGAISTDLIPALQGFAVVVEEGETGSVEIDYDDAVRVVSGSNHNTPLKAPQRYAEADPEPITVYVSGNELRTRIRLFEDETRFSDELDEGWEAYYLKGEGLAGEMYAIGQKKMNVLAKANLEGTVVGFVPGEATNYTISFAGDGKGYYFNDVKTGKSTLIDEANTYEFTSDESTNATRFVISKIPMQPTGVEEVVEGTQARKQLIDGALYIIRDGRIYTATGNAVK